MGSSNFSIEQAINNYISQVGKQGSITNSDAAELKGHLFDAIETLQGQGLSEEESFIIASKCLGSEEVLAEEYSKVNISVKTNKIWAYLIVGFNLIYGLPSFVFTLIAVFYYLIHKDFGNSIPSVVIITVFHVLFTLCLWSIPTYKRRISYFIERQIELKPLRLIFFSFLPHLLNFYSVAYGRKLFPGMSIMYPVHVFGSSWIECSFMVAGLSIVGIVMSLVFSLNKVENLTLRSLFEKPTVPFLIIFGLLVELLASVTRVIHVDILINGIAFGLVYLGASFLVGFFNNKNSTKYLVKAFTLGLLLELVVGWNADLSRGTFYTVYYVLGLILGVSLGLILGIGAKRTLVREIS